MSTAFQHTAFTPPRLSPNKTVILSTQCTSFTCPIVYLYLPVALYHCPSCFTGFRGNEIQGERESAREENKEVCLLCSFTAICVCWSLWESLLAFTLRCAHTDETYSRLHAETCTGDLSCCRRQMACSF